MTTMIQLNASYNPGAFDPGKSYTHMLLDKLHLLKDRAVVELMYGYIEENEFVRGKMQRLSIEILNEDEENLHWDELQARLSSTDEPAVVSIQRCACEHILFRGLLDGIVQTV